jgi:hypothetical protein
MKKEIKKTLERKSITQIKEFNYNNNVEKHLVTLPRKSHSIISYTCILL